MKVLLVSLPEPEGHHVFCFVDSLAHFRADHGIELHLAYAEHQRSDRLQALVDFIRTQGGKPIDLSVNGRLSLSDVRGLRALRAFVKEIRPNIIHSHGAKAGLFAPPFQ